MCLQPSDMESEEESDDDSEYSEASEDTDSEGTTYVSNICIALCFIVSTISQYVYSSLFYFVYFISFILCFIRGRIR